MDVTFVRKPGERDRIYARRSDGSELSWEFASYGEQVPHDLMHVIVEQIFGLARGFWGLVDIGMDPRRVDPHDYPADSEILRAEALAAAFSQQLEDPRVVLSRQGFAMEVSQATEQAVRDELLRATTLWRAEGKVTLRFGKPAP